MNTGQVAAVDLGATSGRVMLANVGAGRLDMHPVARFANTPVRLWNGTRTALHWDAPGLFAHVCDGLAAAARQADNLTAIGVDSWAVDYGLLRDGRLLSLPHHYRDERSAVGVDIVHRAFDAADLYRRNGLQFLPFNTVYQLAAEKAEGLLGLADTALLIPDLINYWLTGRAATERTNASTTGLVGLDGIWDEEVMRRIGLPENLFPEMAQPGTTLGPLLSEVRAQLGVEETVRVVSVASHDTASAVAAIPMYAESAAYISCGTWGLVGIELTSAIVNDASRAANFTNEAGADGRVRFLHNVMGLWLLSETIRQFERDGHAADLDALLDQAAAVPAPMAVFDTDDPRFLPPGDMPARITAWYREHGLPPPDSKAEMVRAILESLAAAFASNVWAAAELSGKDITTVHIVGGGSQNRLLCQLTADRLGLPLLAGPVEATALGNVLLTARTQGLVTGDLEALRGLVAAMFPPQRYAPRTRVAAAQAVGTG
jgi:rhamnulokinase